jgi:hypothetical protein
MYLLQLSGHLATHEESVSRPDEKVKEDAINEGLAAVEAEHGCAMAAEVPCAGYPVFVQDQLPRCQIRNKKQMPQHLDGTFVHTWGAPATCS